MLVVQLNIRVVTSRLIFGIVEVCAVKMPKQMDNMFGGRI